jgi:hypothetical protein
MNLRFLRLMAIAIFNVLSFHVSAQTCNAGTAQVSLSASTLTNTCPATTANLNSLFTGAPPMGTSLVWFTNNAHTGTAYATPGTAAAGTYYAFFYDAAFPCYNTATSTARVVVTITTPPTTPSVTVIQPNCAISTGTAILSNVTASFTVTANPGGITATVPAGAPTVSIDGLVIGNFYTFTQTSTTGCVSSPSASFTINPQPTTYTTPTITAVGATIICPSGNVVLAAAPGSTYQWYKDNAPITGANGQTYAATAAGSYAVSETFGVCSTPTSAATTVTVQDTKPPVFVTGSTQQIADLVNFDDYQPLETGELFAGGYGSGTARVVVNQSRPGIRRVAVPFALPAGSNGSGRTLYIGIDGTIPNTDRNISFTFPQKISDLKFSIFDIDGSTKITLAAYNNGVLQIANATNLVSNGVVITNNNTTAVLINGLANAWNETGPRVAANVSVDGPVDSLILLVTPNTNGDAGLYFSDLTFTHTAPIAATLPTNTTTTCDAIPTAPTLIASDSCGAAPVTYNQTSASNTPTAGQTTLTRTWTATDGSGNTTVHTQTIIVNPSAAPTTASVTQPVCPLNTGSVTLNGLPVAGTWTLTASPDGITSTGTGTSGTLAGLPGGATYAITATSATGCTSYPVNVSINAAPICANLNKTASPSSFIDGGTTTYTWTINNSNGYALTSFGFIDALPTALRVAAVPNIATTGFSTAPVITAAAGGTYVQISGGGIAAGATATISLSITNVAGQTGTCPNIYFTNASTNIINLIGANNLVGAGPCVTVTAACAANAGTLQ